MAYWKEPQEPQEASERRMLARDRVRVMSERQEGLVALPASEHRAFLKALYAKYPTYPHPTRKCWCMKCAGSAL